MSCESLLFEYSELSVSVEQKERMPIQELPTLVNRWMSIEDNIYSFLAKRDSVLDDSAIQTMGKMTLYGNRVIEKVFVLIDKEDITYVDLVDFYHNLNLSETTQDKELAETAYSFFKEYEDVKADIKDPQDQVERIIHFQKTIDTLEVNDFETYKELLLSEDLLFRAFADDVVKHTEDDFDRVNGHNGIISDKIASLILKDRQYLNMGIAYICCRDSHRELYLANVAMKKICKNEIQDNHCAVKLLACIIEPLRNFNPYMDFARSQKMWDEYRQLAERIPEVLVHLNEIGYDTSEIYLITPSFLLKREIAYLFKE